MERVLDELNELANHWDQNSFPVVTDATAHDMQPDRHHAFTLENSSCLCLLSLLSFSVKMACTAFCTLCSHAVSQYEYACLLARFQKY